MGWFIVKNKYNTTAQTEREKGDRLNKMQSKLAPIEILPSMFLKHRHTHGHIIASMNTHLKVLFFHYYKIHLKSTSSICSFPKKNDIKLEFTVSYRSPDR
jgi:hypothetical protein